MVGADLGVSPKGQGPKGILAWIRNSRHGGGIRSGCTLNIDWSKCLNSDLPIQTRCGSAAEILRFRTQIDLTHGMNEDGRIELVNG